MKKLTLLAAASALVASSTFAFAGGPVKIIKKEERPVVQTVVKAKPPVWVWLIPPVCALLCGKGGNNTSATTTTK